MTSYLTFSLQGAEYGWPLSRTEEIVESAAVTPVPETPEWIKGVAALRGLVIPVVELSRRLGLDAAGEGGSSMLIVEVQVAEGRERVGILVERLGRALELAERDILPVPPFGTRVRPSFLRGVTFDGERLLHLLDVDAIMNTLL